MQHVAKPTNVDKIFAQQRRDAIREKSDHIELPISGTPSFVDLIHDRKFPVIDKHAPSIGGTITVTDSKQVCPARHLSSEKAYEQHDPALKLSLKLKILPHGVQIPVIVGHETSNV
jgi:hypothetical protein